MTSYVFRALTFLLLGCWSAFALAADVVVAVMLSERGPGYSAVSDVVQTDLQRSTTVNTVTISYATDGDAMEVLLSKSPKVVISLGAAALRTLLASDTRLPIVAALIPRATYEKVMHEPGRKSTGPVYGIFLDQPFGRQLDLLHLVQPGVRRVGVLWGPDSVVQRSLLQAALAGRGWTEVAGIVAPSVTLGEATKRALDDADALLAIADPAVFNSATVSNVLLASYRAKIGVIGFSPAYVKAGALVGVYSTPTQIGAHTADTVRALLRGGSVSAMQYPVDFTVTANEHVARSLGLSLDEATLTERLKRMERKP